MKVRQPTCTQRSALRFPLCLPVSILILLAPAPKKGIERGMERYTAWLSVYALGVLRGTNCVIIGTPDVVDHLVANGLCFLFPRAL